MADKIIPSLILLTYRGKVLLMNRKNSAIDDELHPWCFIGAVRQENESFEKAISRRVESETGIKIGNIKHISGFCYYAILTDDNVNNMKREENQLLDFFKPMEVKKLILTRSTEEVFLKHFSLI